MKRVELALRLWGSLSEPRVITAIIVVIYALVGFFGVSVLFDATPLVGIGGVLVVIGSFVALPSAWRGAWWLEGPVTVLVVLGLLWMVVSGSNHHPILLVSLTLFFVTRIFRVWPNLYRPGMIPASRIEIAKAHMESAQEAENRAAARRTRRA